MKTIRTGVICLGLLAMAAPLVAQTNEIEHRERVTLTVGESVVVYGYRGDCGQLPTPDQIDLPTLSTGTLSVGQPGFRNSRRCNGDTPAVEVIFTATTPGRERFELQGDAVSVRVRN